MSSEFAFFVVAGIKKKEKLGCSTKCHLGSTQKRGSARTERKRQRKKFTRALEQQVSSSSSSSSVATLVALPTGASPTPPLPPMEPHTHKLTKVAHIFRLISLQQRSKCKKCSTAHARWRTFLVLCRRILCVCVAFTCEFVTLKWRKFDSRQQFPCSQAQMRRPHTHTHRE